MEENKNVATEGLAVQEMQDESYKSGSVQYIDSREVAKMVGKEHRKLLRDIRTYISQIKEISEGQNPKSKIGLSDLEPKRKIAFSDFFIDSSYNVKGQNKAYPCYLVTKKGCEFIAHKLTGTKGTEFTARYINRFHEMQDELAGGRNEISAEQEQRLLDYMERQEERIGQLEKRVEMKGIKYQPNPFKPGESADEQRLRNLNALTRKVSKLYGLKKNKLLHYLYRTIEENLGVSIDSYSEVYRETAGHSWDSTLEVVCNYDNLYHEAVKLCEEAIERKKIFGSFHD